MDEKKPYWTNQIPLTGIRSLLENMKHSLSLIEEMYESRRVDIATTQKRLMRDDRKLKMGK